MAGFSIEELRGRAAVHPYWYHSFSFDTGETIRGQYDVGADVDGYGFPAVMKGLRVLDVGTASGWFAFYFEQQGADVTAVDVRSDDDLEAYGRWHQPQPPAAISLWIGRRPTTTERRARESPSAWARRKSDAIPHGSAAASRPGQTSFVLPGIACCGAGSDDVQVRSFGKRSSFDSFVRKSQVTFCPV
jgi:hypothetical protein